MFGQLSLTQQEGHQGRVEVAHSGAKVLDRNSSSVRKGSGFFEDDLIPDSEIISMFSCAVASLPFRAAGHFCRYLFFSPPTCK